jgi:hypothetical protein
MSETIQPVRPERLVQAAPSPRARPESSFAEALAESESAGESLLDASLNAARQMARGQRRIERAVRRARHGGGLAPEQLLALQAGVYRTTQELELASKLVEKATGAVKQTLQSQR